jgi:hypothetical protein
MVHKQNEDFQNVSWISGEYQRIQDNFKALEFFSELQLFHVGTLLTPKLFAINFHKCGNLPNLPHAQQINMILIKTENVKNHLKHCQTDARKKNVNPSH